MATVEMTKENHDELIKEGIVFIDMWAEWCGPCRNFAPIFEQASENNEDVTFAKVDTEDQRELMMQYGVTSIPTIIVYRDGIPVFNQPGAMRQADFDSLVAQVKELDMDKVRKAYEEALAKHQSENH